jgi:hypothetical protein
MQELQLRKPSLIKDHFFCTNGKELRVPPKPPPESTSAPPVFGSFILLLQPSIENCKGNIDTRDHVSAYLNVKYYVLEGRIDRRSVNPMRSSVAWLRRYGTAEECADE